MIRQWIIVGAGVFLLFGAGRAVRSQTIGGQPTAGSDQERLRSVCVYGITAAFQGNLTRAESSFVQVLYGRPGDARALTNLGNLRIMRGDARVALSFYDAAALADTADAGIVLNQATALYLCGDTTAADLTYARGIELAGGFREAAYLLGLYVESDESDSKAADKSRFRKTELLRRLDAAMRLIPADTSRTGSDSTRARKVRTRRPARYRIGAARAGEETIASVLYWGR